MTADTGGATVIPLRFQIGARTLAATPRRLVRVPLSLNDVMASRIPVLSPPGVGTDGYLVTSFPADRLAEFATAGCLARVRQSYTRHHVDLSKGVADWEAALSSATRAGLKRKVRKLGAAIIRRYCTPDEIAIFHPLARRVSEATYQEALLDAGLPRAPEELLRLAAADRVRAWLLFVDEEPVAYLCCTAMGDTLRYDHVGHLPREGARSPGVVLQVHALRDLLAEGRFRWFDFTEGDGQHKRSLATGGTACVDLLLLRPTLANRGILAGLGVFDRAVAIGKWAARGSVLAPLVNRVRR